MIMNHPSVSQRSTRYGLPKPESLGIRQATDQSGQRIRTSGGTEPRGVRDKTGEPRRQSPSNFRDENIVRTSLATAGLSGNAPTRWNHPTTPLQHHCGYDGMPS